MTAVCRRRERKILRLSRHWGVDFERRTSRPSKLKVSTKGMVINMIDFIYTNISTIIIGIVLAAIVGMVIAKMVRDKKKGKSSCGGSCAGCPSNCSCHPKK